MSTAAAPLALPPAPAVAMPTDAAINSLKSFVSSTVPAAASTSSSGGWTWWLKYLIIFGLIGFLLLILLVFLAHKYGKLDLPKIFALVSSATAAAGAKDTGAKDTGAKNGAGAKDTGSTNGKDKDKPAVKMLEDYIDDKKGKAQGGGTPDEPQPDDAGSRTQSTKAKSKAGYCYIGEDRGFRSCIQVGDNDTCMSGDIFPTMDVCINPTLRA